MSLTCLQILAGAAGKLGVLAIGRSLTSAQSEQGMEIFRSLYLEMVGQGVFGPLLDTWVTDAAYTAHENERVICDATVTTVTLPTTITQEWYPNTGYIGGFADFGWSNSSSSATYPRAPRDNAIIQVARTNLSSALTYIYDAPQTDWVAIDSLLVATAAPLSERYGEALKAKMAEKWAANWGVTPEPILAKEIAQANSLLSHRYDRIACAAVGNYF
jgi:hypothetical protein